MCIKTLTPLGYSSLSLFFFLKLSSMYVRQLLEDVKSEMTEDGTYGALIKVIEESGRREIEENVTMLNYSESNKIVEGLKRELEDEVIDNEREVEELRAELHRLRVRKKTCEILHCAREKKKLHRNDELDRKWKWWKFIKCTLCRRRSKKSKRRQSVKCDTRVLGRKHSVRIVT